MSEFAAHKAFEEAAERHEHTERHGATWVPIAAAILAVITAIFSLLAAQTSTEALVAKNEAILETTRASDAYNEYEARSIKQHIYEALVTSGLARDAKKVTTVAAHERDAGKPAFANAKAFEKRAGEANSHAAHLLLRLATMEIGITFLDISIVLVSISALTTTRVLTAVAVLGAAGGIITSLIGLLR